jgi:hypothetical protein
LYSIKRGKEKERKKNLQRDLFSFNEENRKDANRDRKTSSENE